MNTVRVKKTRQNHEAKGADLFRKPGKLLGEQCAGAEEARPVTENAGDREGRDGVPEVAGGTGVRTRPASRSGNEALTRRTVCRDRKPGRVTRCCGTGSSSIAL